MKFRRLKNRGSINPLDWVVALALFVSAYFTWSITNPVVQELLKIAKTMLFPDVVNALLSMTELSYQYGSIICAAIPIVYLILSSIREEVEERAYPVY